MKLTAKQKQQLVGLIDWFFSTLETPVKATAVPEIPDEYPNDGDSEAPAGGAPKRAPRQFPDSSVKSSIPELQGFVPSAQMNGTPRGHTDSGDVKRI